MKDKLLREKEILKEHGIGFKDDFLDDIESWFSADIACCDNCYDQFLEYWPLANEENDYEFQRSYIDLDTFYSGSKSLQHFYTPEEYDVLKHTIQCPRCGANLEASMWVYDLPFSSEIDTFDFELEIESIAELSKTTPFLLLKNNYASKVYDLLHDIVNKTNAQDIDDSLYRARIANRVDRLHFDEFTVAPKEFIQEGRYNHAGEQVLYLATKLTKNFVMLQSAK